MADTTVTLAAPVTTVTDAKVAENPGLESSISINQLQGIPSIDEALLMGDESTIEEKDEKKTKDETDEQKSTDVKQTTDSSAPKDESSKKTEVKEGDEKEPEEKKTEVVPKGYVKLEALKESRETIKSLKAELNALKVRSYETEKVFSAQVAPLVTEAEIKNFEAFKVLSDTELEEMIDDDPAAGLKYAKELTKFQDFTKRLQEQKTQKIIGERDAEQASARLQVIYDTTADQMEEHVPGLFTDEAVQTEFQEFAKSIGFTDDLFYLTNPETRIILPGESEPLLLGEQAASIIKMLAGVKKSTSATKNDVASVETLTKEIEARLRVDIEKELLTKFKGASPKKAFQSIDEISTSDSDNKFAGRVLSDIEFSKLSPTDQDEYLKGP